MNSVAARCVRVAACLGLLLLAAWASPAAADQPLQTEDADVLDRGRCEIEAAALRFSKPSARDDGLAAACGIGWQSQVGLGGSRARAGSESARGISIGGKTGLRPGDDGDEPQWSIAWSLDWQRERGGSTEAAGRAITLVGSIPWKAWVLHLNLGHARDLPAQRSSTTWAAALEHEAWSLGAPGTGVTIAPLVETFGDDRESPWVAAGLRAVLFANRLSIGLAYGRRLGGEKPRLWTLGLKTEF